MSVDADLASHRTPEGNPDWDVVRRAKLKALEDHTGRPALIYACDFLNNLKLKLVGNDVQINLADKHGFFEATDKITDKNIDVLLHSPGGLPDAAESIIDMLRNKFENVRFIIPNVAKSAATMMAMAGDEIWMDANAELGPIDPQFVIGKGAGQYVQSPAQAIVDQFDEAQVLIGKDPSKLPAWLPVLQQYGPSLYKEALNAIDLSKRLVEGWLNVYMFKGHSDGPEKAKAIAEFLGDHNQFKSHGRRIGRKVLQDKGANIKNLEDDPILHARVVDVYFAMVHTFNGACFKMFENSRGQGLFLTIPQPTIQLPPGLQMIPVPNAPKPQQAPPLVQAPPRQN
jgi:hypothetical protein